MTDDYLIELVRQALRNAAANGYDLTEWQPRTVARDMQRYDARLEDYTVDQLEEAVYYAREIL